MTRTETDTGKERGTGRRNALILSVCQGLFTCAISIDLTLTGLTGPACAAWSKALFPAALFAGAYLMVAILGLATTLLLLAFYRDLEPAPAATQQKGELCPRPLGEILRQPIFVASVANNVVGS